MNISALIQVIGSMLLAAIPAIIWLYLFRGKHPEGRKVTLSTFLIGAVSVMPILIYRYLWEFFPWINAFQYIQGFDNTIININSALALPLSIIFTFMIIGVIEEVTKHYCVRTVDKKFFKSIDDVIEFSIIAALGFSFTENILYFHNIWELRGLDNLLKPFLFRSVFSTFAHIMFSGIFGYYYGLGLFAKPILQEQMVQNRTLFSRAFYKIINIRTEKAFYQEKLIAGLIVAVLLHAMFNIFLELNLTYLTVPYLVFGYVILNYLFDKKESHKQYGLLQET